MSVRRTFHCDGPECDAHVNSAAEHPPTFLSVFEEAGHPHEQRHELHYCGWDCLLKAAAAREPAEIVLLDEGNGDGR